MTDDIRAREGDWVEVECKLLDPADRSKNLPPETAEKPLMMWVKGFSEGEAALGEQLTIATITGRKVTGALSAVNPGYFITYGNPIPELTHVGRDLRARLAAYRAAETGLASGAPAGPAAGGCGCGCDCAPAEGGEC
jgi:2-amino-4-ketopentanoate thiolase alpha subunit